MLFILTADELERDLRRLQREHLEKMYGLQKELDDLRLLLMMQRNQPQAPPPPPPPSQPNTIIHQTAPPPVSLVTISIILPLGFLLRISQTCSDVYILPTICDVAKDRKMQCYQ